MKSSKIEIRNFYHILHEKRKKIISENERIVTLHISKVEWDLLDGVYFRWTVLSLITFIPKFICKNKMKEMRIFMACWNK